jgi:hypothetical protein
MTTTTTTTATTSRTTTKPEFIFASGGGALCRDEPKAKYTKEHQPRLRGVRPRYRRPGDRCGNSQGGFCMS